MPATLNKKLNVWCMLLYQNGLKTSLNQSREKGSKSLKFMYSEKATKFCEISTNYFSYILPVKYLVEISQTFVAFPENMNFNQNSPLIHKYLRNLFSRVNSPQFSSFQKKLLLKPAEPKLLVILYINRPLSCLITA